MYKAIFNKKARILSVLLAPMKKIKKSQKNSKKGIDILKKKCIIYYVARNSVQYAGVAELADAHV